MLRELLSTLLLSTFGSLVLIVEPQESNLRSALEVFPPESKAAFVVCVRGSGQMGLWWSAPLSANDRRCEYSASFTPLATSEPLICADIMPTQVGCAGPPEIMSIDGSSLPIGVKDSTLIVYSRNNQGAHEVLIITPDASSVWRFIPP